jgi:hypothetical protein
MKAELNEFWNTVPDEEESRLKEEFRNNMNAARVFKDIKHYQQMIECLYRANAVALFLDSIKKK